VNGFISNICAINFPYSSCWILCGDTNDFFYCKEKYAKANSAAYKKFNNTKRAANIF